MYCLFQRSLKNQGSKMKASLLTRFVLICLLSTFLSSCAPKISDDLRSQMTRMLEEGATLTAMTEQGVNYADFGQQLAKVKGAYDLATAS